MASPRILVRVQHHPSRAELIPPLLKRLKGLKVEVVEHGSDPPSPWAGYRKCLDELSRRWTHLLVIQDDTVPADNFAAALRQIAAKQPTHPVCLFLGRLPRDASTKAERALKMNRRYVGLSWRSFLPVVATLWPLERVLNFRDWADLNTRLPGTGATEPRSDDAMAGRWKMINRANVLACVPSIVQHPDQVPSTIGRTAAWGRDKSRIACLYTDDATRYDWSQE